MAEQDTSPDEEMTPEAMAEEADEMLKLMRWLKYGQGQRFLELLGATVHELRTFLERGLDREQVVEMANWTMPRTITPARPSKSPISKGVSSTTMPVAPAPALAMPRARPRLLANQ
jgi:hypothetical protein